MRDRFGAKTFKGRYFVNYIILVSFSRLMLLSVIVNFLC